MICRSLDPVVIYQHGGSNLEYITLAIVAGSSLWNSGNKAQEVYGAVNLTVFIITDGIFEKTIRRNDVEIICDLKYIKFIVRV